MGFTSGQFMRIGANSVVPNGANGTTGLATTVDLLTGNTFQTSIPFNPGPIIPNFYQRLLFDNPNRYGDWTLTFTNGPDSASAVVAGLPAGSTQAPFVNSITLSGTSANPTFSWTPPPGTDVNGYRVNIYDKSLVAPGNNGQVTSRNLQPGTTSYTVVAADFTLPGYAFTEGKNYAIEISLIQTRDGSSSNLANNNLKAISRYYADFTPTAAGGPVVNLPVVLANGSYQFNITVQPGQVYYIDPEIAIGYDYAIGQGNPNFASVLLPNVGDGLFDIFGLNALGQWVLLEDDWAAGVAFDFGAGGVSQFRVLGIETSAGLNPANTTAFITGLTFTGAGAFTGTQTPITVTVDLPEPPVWALAALAALAGAGLRRRRAQA
jgi:MYXO-CTERM domain-containing protein